MIMNGLGGPDPCSALKAIYVVVPWMSIHRSYFIVRNCPRLMYAKGRFPKTRTTSIHCLWVAHASTAQLVAVPFNRDLRHFRFIEGLDIPVKEGGFWVIEQRQDARYGSPRYTQFDVQLSVVFVFGNLALTQNAEKQDREAAYILIADNPAISGWVTMPYTRFIFSILYEVGWIQL